VFPQYGFGWYAQDGTSLEVPPEFEMGSSITENDESFSLALGQVSTEGHPLHSLWVLLTQRTDGGDPTYNLHAYKDRPEIPDHRSPVPEATVLTGFATVREGVAP